MKYSVRLEKTADGSHTLFIPEMDEHYHSVNGAVQESKHVFIEAGLQQINKDRISVLEIGFGTGLNAYLTLLHSIRFSSNIYYCGIELYPLSDTVVNQINYPDEISEDNENKSLFYKLHEAEWNKKTEITSGFSLRKINKDFTFLDTIDKQEYFDVIYFDAFAPDKQNDMWNQDIFNYLYTHTNQQGILVTYCAKGSVRRMLQAAGFLVERLPGPKGKREMLRAIKK